MDHKTNTAGRLVLLLREAKKRTDVRGSSSIKVWQILLKVPENKVSLVLHRYGQILEMPEQIKAQVLRQEETTHELFLRWMPKIEAAFKSCNLDAQFAAFIDQIDETTLQALEFCSDLLGRKAPEKLLNEEEMQAIYSDASTLLDQVLSLDIDESVKRFIVDRLDSVMNAIQEYDFRGLRPLDTALEASVGAIYRNQTVFRAVCKNANGEALWKILGRVEMLLKLGQGVAQIADIVGKLLPP